MQVETGISTPPSGDRPSPRSPPGPSPRAGSSDRARSSFCAVFDLDGTLLPGDSHRRLFLFLAACPRVAPRTRAAMLSGAVGHLFGLRGNRWTKAVVARALAGWTREEIGALAEREARGAASGIFPAMGRILARHRREGACILLLSASLDVVVEPVARELGVDIWAGTPLELRAGRATGRLAGPNLHGPEKAVRLRALAQREGLDLAASYAYADDWSDRFLLEAVGHPAAVAPGRRLARLARRRGWDVLPAG